MSGPNLMKLNLCYRRREHCLNWSRSEQWKGREAAFPASYSNFEAFFFIFKDGSHIYTNMVDFIPPLLVLS